MSSILSKQKNIRPKTRKVKKKIYFLYFNNNIIFIIIREFNVHQKKSNKVYVQFSLKVTNQKGRPIVGAKIFDKNKLIGITDSFGDWNRYLKYLPGTTLNQKLKSKRKYKNNLLLKIFLFH